jgi:hypothetical protein
LVRRYNDVSQGGKAPNLRLKTKINKNKKEKR